MKHLATHGMDTKQIIQGVSIDPRLDDHITIYSPGLLYGGLSLAELNFDNYNHNCAINLLLERFTSLATSKNTAVASTNLYGPSDNHDLNSSRALPALNTWAKTTFNAMKTTTADEKQD